MYNVVFQDNPSFDPGRCTAFQCDIVNDELTNQVPEEVVDVATMIFVLSAVHPDKMEIALRKIHKVFELAHEYELVLITVVTS